VLRQWETSTWPKRQIDTCHHCGVRVRHVRVRFRDGSTRSVVISTNADEWGEIYRNREGEWRALRASDKRFAGVPYFRLHGYMACSDEAEWLGDANGPGLMRTVARDLAKVGAS
jgi:hypothetical protein